MNQPVKSRTLSLKTPGAAAPEVVDTPEARAQLAAENEALEQSLISGGDTVLSDAAPTEPAVAPDLKAYIDAQIAQGVAKSLATTKRATTIGTPPAELPDQAEIDAFAITKEVLTKQGYVVPHQYPQPAGVPQAMR